MNGDTTDSGRILVVDDDPFNADLLKTKLTALGYEVTVAHSAEEALEADVKAHPHLILLDVVLPEMSGFEACRRFNEIHTESHVPVILVSGCHIGDCHYIDANHWTEKRIKKVHKKMEKLGIRPERLQLEWVSAAEGVRFARVMEGLEALRRSVTSEEIADTIKRLKAKKK